MTQLNSSHRRFLQSFMSRSVLDAKDVKHLYKNECEVYSSVEEESRRNFTEFVITVNNSIKPFHMEIKKGFSEEDGTNYYCLVSTSDTGITKLASEYTPTELEYYKKLIETIVETEEGYIGSMEALNLVEHLTKTKKMTKTDAENLLQRLQESKWVTVKNGEISLSTRTILELEMYIKDTYPEITKLCEICKKLCIKGQSCDDCGVKLHIRCATNIFSKQTQRKCPGQNCNAAWVHDIITKG
ncbi:hypothetical protein LOTGIDRAFT_127737 [Lottia gigantea]|uniref:Non-structural maintenance of chromosomes element 1 homolog n=1 Tax=Lottia gigantea TaxID=225164 RepID=V4A2Q5_LOTGI|nr:hypothetical protein LOTGIDRAFT_127737 [Lottia gigantea]ESO87581.1 hypothetical protein LOTGIDRAFT_127737 [Lottia gigantea]